MEKKHIPNMEKLRMIKQILKRRKENLQYDICYLDIHGSISEKDELHKELEVRKELLDYVEILIDIEQDYPILGIQIPLSLVK